MQAAWYEHRGPARDVLVVGHMADPEPCAGEVRIRLAFSGINPGDVKKRSGWQGAPMPYPRVIPHSDGSGVVDALGAGVANLRLGQAVWCYAAQSYRAFGTAAQQVVVPAALVVPLPQGADADAALMQQAACLGIAGITGYRAVLPLDQWRACMFWCGAHRPAWGPLHCKWPAVQAHRPWPWCAAPSS